MTTDKRYPTRRVTTTVERVVRGQTAAALGAVLLVLSCGAPEACSDDGEGCPSALSFRGHFFTERAVDSFQRGEELGDGIYPGCRDGTLCGTGQGGFGSDVWRLNGVDPRVAVVSLRRDTHRYVVFARVGTSPGELSRDLAGAG